MPESRSGSKRYSTRDDAGEKQNVDSRSQLPTAQQQAPFSGQDGKFSDPHNYDIMSIDIVQGIGDTSASLGLISTLVFSIAVSIVGDIEVAGNESRTMLLCMSISFSTYTTVYSLLEYYYAHCLMTLQHYMDCREPRAVAQEDGPAETASGSAMILRPAGSSLLLQTHGDLMKLSIDGFTEFNNMRAWARNSTWAAIIFILAATGVRLALNGNISDLRAWKAFGCCGTLLLYSVVWMSALNASTDMKAYAAFSVVGMVASACVACTGHSDFDMPRVISSATLLCGICSVVLTVRAFRSCFMPLVKANAKAF